jgi:hypothetical protein
MIAAAIPRGIRSLINPRRERNDVLAVSIDESNPQLKRPVISPGTAWSATLRGRTILVRPGPPPFNPGRARKSREATFPAPMNRGLLIRSAAISPCKIKHLIALVARLLRGRNRGAETRWGSACFWCDASAPHFHETPRADCCDRSTVRRWPRSRKARPGARTWRLRIGSAANPQPPSFQPTARAQVPPKSRGTALYGSGQYPFCRAT